MNYDEDQIKAIKEMNNTLVIAGAGSGKTTTIVGKVDYLLKNNYYKEEELLIISFTNETVNSLKSRIKYNIDIKTFHKLALDIIKNVDNNISISNDYYLKYIIEEYINSYGTYNKKTNIIIKRILKTKNKTSLINLIITFINVYKCNFINIDYLFNLYNNSIFLDKYYLKLILDIYIIYKRELESCGKADFNDLIIKANEYIKNNIVKTKYKYIIIDEFQDISLIRYKLIENILKQNNGKIFAVGDDFQSIYRFSGCDLSLFIDINKLIPDLKILKLNHNYRNNQSLVNIANKFVLKNKKQIIKNTICHKDSNMPIKIVFYKNKKEILNKITKEIEGNILVLGRNNIDKEVFNVKEDNNIKFLTIHKAKGLEEDNVILLNLYNNKYGFPSKIKNEKIISKLLKKDYIMHEEERRLFYVAITRTRNNIYLLVPKENYSIFVHEIIQDNKKNLDYIYLDN